MNNGRKQGLQRLKETAQVNRTIRELVYEKMILALKHGQGKKDPFFERFIDLYINLALEDPDSKAAELIGKVFFSGDLLDRLNDYESKGQKTSVDNLIFNISRSLYKEQLDVFHSLFVYKNVYVMTSRRTGKTTAMIPALLVASALEIGNSCYICRSYKNAKKQCLPYVVELLDKQHISYKIDNTSGVITLSNGNIIMFHGNNDNSRADSLRGYKFACPIIDEAGVIRGLDYLINDILSPAMLDYKRSTLYLFGTPSPYPNNKFNTLFSDCTNEGGAVSFSWNFKKNPFLEGADSFVENFCATNHLSIDDPFIQREFFGKIALDDSLKFFTPSNFAGLDFTPTHIVLGVDYGFTDSTAICTLAFDKQTNKGAVISEQKFNGKSADYIIDQIELEYAKALTTAVNYNILAKDVFCFCDTNEKAITQSLILRGVNAYNAKKTNRDDNLLTLATYINKGLISVPENGIFHEEAKMLIKKRDESTGAILPTIDNDYYHPDFVFALLYAFRYLLDIVDNPIV